MTVTKKSKRTEAIRHMILENSAEVFAEKGYYGATMGEIARMADFSAGSLYLYFDSKETLFKETVDYISNTFIESITVSHQGPDTSMRGDLFAVLQATRDFARKRRRFLIMIMNQHMSVDDDCRTEMEQLRREHFVQYIDHIKALIQKAEIRGEVSPGRCADLAWSFGGIVHFYIIRSILFADSPDSDGRSEVLLDIFLHGALESAGTQHQGTTTAKSSEEND